MGEGMAVIVTVPSEAQVDAEDEQTRRPDRLEVGRGVATVDEPAVKSVSGSTPV
jgi:hypothetical protein